MYNLYVDCYLPDVWVARAGRVQKDTAVTK